MSAPMLLLKQVSFVLDVCMLVIGMFMFIALLIFRFNSSRSKHLQFAPTLIFSGNLSLQVVAVWDICLRLFIGDYLSVASAVIIEWIFASMILHSWLAVTASLYVAFNQAQERTALMDRGLNNAKKKAILRRLKIYRKLLIPKTYVYFMLGCTLLFQIPVQIAVIFMLPDLRTTLYSEVEMLPGLHWLAMELGGMVHCSIGMTILLNLALKSRIVVDSLGIKSMLVAVAECVVGSTVGYIVAQIVLVIVFPDSLVLYARNFVLCAGNVSIFIVSVGLPLYRSFNEDGVGVSGTGGTSSEGHNKLQNFLRIQKYSDAFKKHLQTEYSVENLQFWLAVDQFEERFGPSSPESGNFRGKNESALELYRMFLRRGAPQEVNLPSNILISFRDDIFSSVDGSGEATVVPDDAISFLQCPYNVFADAKECIFDLLQKDSFPRFLKKKENANLWNEFVQREIESNVMMNLHTTKGKTTGHRAGTDSSFGSNMSLVD